MIAMKIVVLGGGLSTERHVSLVTATSVCKALRQRGYKGILEFAQYVSPSGCLRAFLQTLGM